MPGEPGQEFITARIFMAGRERGWMLDSNSEPMNAVDTAWLRMDRPTNLMVVTAMIVIERCDFHDFTTLIRQRFLAFDRFLKRPVCHSGLYFWEPDEGFELDYHVRRSALPGNADKEELQRFIADLAAVPLDPARPLWQFHFVENYGDSCAIVMRIHHCYADGLSLVSIFAALTDDTAERVEPASATSVGPEQPAANDNRAPGLESWDAYQVIKEAALKSLERYGRFSLKMSEGGLHMLREPSSLKDLGRMALSVLAEASRLTALPSDPETALKGRLGAGKVCLWSEPIALERIKQLGRAYGCSLNDVLLSCVSGALRRYLESYQPVGPDFEIHATVPVNVRALDEQGELVPEQALGNQFGTLFMALPLGVRNPVERIYRIKYEMQRLRRSWQPGISYGLLTALGLMPGRIQRQIIDLFSRKSSLVLSNVPGIQQARYLAGSRVHEAMFWVPQSGESALGISLLSYNQQVQIGLLADRQVVRAPRQLLEAFMLELEAHEAAAPPATQAKAEQTFAVS